MLPGCIRYSMNPWLMNLQRNWFLKLMELHCFRFFFVMTGAAMAASPIRPSKGRDVACAALPDRLRRGRIIQRMIDRGSGEHAKAYLIQLHTEWRIPGMEVSSSF